MAKLCTCHNISRALIDNSGTFKPIPAVSCAPTPVQAQAPAPAQAPASTSALTSALDSLARYKDKNL